jgi:outer membrane protein TolC
MFISRFRAAFASLALITTILALASPAAAEPLTLRRAVELSLQHSTGVAIADAEAKRAEKGVLETRNAYIPQVIVGAGLGYNQGFPLSLENLAPSLLNVTTQAYVFNMAQREFLKAARRDLAGFTKMADDRRAQVVFETALAYAELDKVEQALSILQKQESTAGRLQTVVQERLQAGVDSQVELTRAQLNAARVRLAMEQSRGQRDLLRTRLSQLTGLPAESIETVADSVPPLPAPPLNEDGFVSKALSVNTNIQVANEQAAAKELRAKGEHRQLLPSVDSAMQYAMLAHYNNYDVFFRRDTFQRHNLTVGVVVRFPIFNTAQKAHAEAADYEALKAKKEAEDVKNQVATEAMKLQQSVRQLAAAREVAHLEYQLAGNDVQTVQARMETGAATVRDQENARLAENQKYAAYLDTSFELDKALMQLLRATGEIESWAMSGK